MSKPCLRTAIFCLSFFVSFVVIASNATPAGDVDQSVFEYDILREGKTVGSHLVLLRYHDDHTLVESSSIIEVGLFGLTFYRFRYESIEKWDDRGLRRLQVRVDDDGESMDIDGRRVGDSFTWTINDAS